MNNKNWILDIPKYENKFYSQGTQDGIIRYIVSNLEIPNKFCVEFGCDTNTLTGGCGANTADLIINHKWQNLWLGGDFENPSINLHKHFLTTDNICEIFEKYNVPKNFGYLSVDVDSTDLWLLDKILQFYQPCFFSVEYNLNIPNDYAITFPNDSTQTWQFDKMFGASLKCFDIVAKKYGYSFVYAMNFKNSGGHDAFFIRNDLIIDCNIPHISSFRSVQQQLHNKCTSGRHTLMLDYEVFLQTGNINLSREAALHITNQYIAK